MTPQIPLPAGAVEASEWETEVSDSDETFRIAWGAEQAANDEVKVLSSVCQLRDGSLKDFCVLVVVDGHPGQLDSSEARQMAAYLLDAADEIDAWAATSTP
jgi:hypothetical protein